MNSFLAIACASITGICLGITLHHKQSISSVSVESAAALQQNSTALQTGEINSSSFEHSAQQPGSSAQSTPLASTQLKQQLNSLLEQQTIMRNQQSELNRELNAIQFRLDIHSESFRPLHTERDNQSFSTSPSEPPISLSPLLPPRQ